MELDKIFNELSVLKTFKDRKEYCKNNFKYISSGMGREVYNINDKFALKLAKNDKGIAQNQSEIHTSFKSHGRHNPVFNHVIKYDAIGRFTVVKLAEKLTKIKFQKLTGITFDTFTDFIWLFHYEKLGNQKEVEHFNNKNPIIQKYYDEEIDNHLYDFLKNVQDIFSYTDIEAVDLDKISSWALIDNLPVLVDFGLKCI